MLPLSAISSHLPPGWNAACDIKSSAVPNNASQCQHSVICQSLAFENDRAKVEATCSRSSADLPTKPTLVVSGLYSDMCISSPVTNI